MKKENIYKEQGPVIEQIQDAVEMGFLEPGTPQGRQLAAHLGQVPGGVLRDWRGTPHEDVRDVIGRMHQAGGGCAGQVSAGLEKSPSSIT